MSKIKEKKEKDDLRELENLDALYNEEVNYFNIVTEDKLLKEELITTNING